MLFLPSNLRRAGQTAKSAALVLCGMAALARSQLAGQGAVLAFHGLREDGVSPGVLDESLHLPISTFSALCKQLAAKYHVMPLSEMASVLSSGEKLPPRAVALSFDDGYASNFELGFPVLKKLNLPATIFLATGFLDGSTPLWFQQVDLALKAGGRSAFSETLARLKKLPNAEMREEVRKMVEAAGESQAPAVTRPMCWDQVRAMRDTGLIEFGGHTHTHPILARCTIEEQRREIVTCRERIQSELGTAPRLFAFPNGGPGDCTPETLGLLKEAGFESAWTMISGRAKQKGPILHMPRYGAPESVWETEATVSGAFELLRKWRGGTV